VTDPIRSADLLVGEIAKSEKLRDDLAADPIGTLNKVADLVTKQLPQPAYVGDKLLYRIVVSVLGIAVLVALAGAVILTVALPTAPIPEVTTALGAASIGALAGLLTPVAAQK
jgi:hypothetical protein